MTVELGAWAPGAGGGIVFAALPDALRRPAVGGADVRDPRSGLSFDARHRPGARGESMRRSRSRCAERIALAADHTLYGLVLAEPRPRPADAEVAV